MSGLRNDQAIHIRLLNLITAEVKYAFDLAETACNRNQLAGEEYILAAEVLNYLKRSRAVIDSLIEWNEYQLVGKRNFSSNLRFKTELIIQSLRSESYKRLVFINNVRDLSGLTVDTTLYKFVLKGLLEFLIRADNLDRKLEISSSVANGRLIIELAGIDFPVNDSWNEHLNKTAYNSVYSSKNEDFPLLVCYDILCYFGGNLWSQGKTGCNLSLYFSLPVSESNF